MADLEGVEENNEPAEAHPAALAYAQIADAIAAVPDEDVIPIRVDVSLAVTLVLGALPRVRALRPQIMEMLRKFDFDQFDQLEVYARALHHADVRWRAASVAKADVATLAGELIEARDRLMRSADALAAHGLISDDRLKGLRKQPGYRAVATDVATIVEVIRERWSVVKGNTPLTLSDLDALASRALDLLVAIAQKQKRPMTVGEAASHRNRAFTLFARTYDEARRRCCTCGPKTALRSLHRSTPVEAGAVPAPRFLSGLI
jgi:hypothetical protein